MAINHTDPSGHFLLAALDTAWDIVDVYSDVRDCFGDSDSMACAMLPVDALAVVALFAEGPSNNVARKTARAADAGEGAADMVRRGGGALVPYGGYGTVLKATPADADDIRAFGRTADKFQAARGQRSFHPLYWEGVVAEQVASGHVDDWFIHRSGASVTGAMEVSSRSGYLEVMKLESLGGGGGSRLMQAAAQESVARGFGGRIQLYAAEQAVDFYWKLGPSRFDPLTNLFVWDEYSVMNLLYQR